MFTLRQAQGDIFDFLRVHQPYQNYYLYYNFNKFDKFFFPSQNLFPFFS
jgi:hypothetical protein